MPLVRALQHRTAVLNLMGEYCVTIGKTRTLSVFVVPVLLLRCQHRAVLNSRIGLGFEDSLQRTSTLSTNWDVDCI